MEARGSKGFITLFLLLVLLLLCTVAAGTGRIVQGECGTSAMEMRWRQLHGIAGSLMCAAVRLEETRGGLESFEKEIGELLPGRSAVTAKLDIRRHPAGFHSICVSVHDRDGNDITLRRNSVDIPRLLMRRAPPGGKPEDGAVERKENASESMLYMSKTEDNQSTNNLLYGATARDFPMEDLGIWFGAVSFLRSIGYGNGLEGRMYHLKKREGPLMRVRTYGRGLILLEEDAVINRWTVLEDDVVILAKKYLHMGRKVSLRKALVICRGEISAEEKTVLQGVLIADKRGDIAPDFEYREDRSVIKPFHTVIYKTVYN